MTQTLTLLAASDPMQHVLPHEIVAIGPFTFTNHMLMLLISAALMVVVFSAMAKRYPAIAKADGPTAPRGFVNAFESVLTFIRNDVAYPSLHEHTDRFLPFLWTLFFFILFNNLLGLIPLDAFASSIFGIQHVFGTATAGLSVTAGLAAIAFFVFHGAGVQEQYRHALHHGKTAGAAAILALPLYLKTLAPTVPGVIGKILFLPLLGLEFILSFVKPFALAIRLFANMLAGHVVLASLLAMAPAIRHLSDWGIAVPTVLGCAALSILELFVAFLQAYIFTFLTCMFIGAAVSPDH
jgi:F-type H+-transporting ATPase subunit a